MKNKYAEKRLARARQTAGKQKARAAGFNFAGWGHNMGKRITALFRRGDEPKERQELLERMTNWQRNQALKECKGSLRDMPTERLRFWREAPHWKKALAA